MTDELSFFISVTTNLFVFKNDSTSTSNLPSFSLEDSSISRRTKRIAAIIKVTKITVVRRFIERQHPFLLDSLNEIMNKNYTVNFFKMYIIYITIILIIELTLITHYLLLAMPDDVGSSNSIVATLALVGTELRSTSFSS